jgi:hypothetical protein
MAKISKNRHGEYANRIASEFDGILPYHEIFYIRAIGFAAERALQAFHRFGKAMQDDKHSPLVVASLQEALNHCAAISRFFWPSTNDVLAVARGTTLRRAFRMSDDNPLQSRAIRKHVEHFDERLDRF